MERIFVSYKRKNMEQVFPIVKEIESALGLKCWVDLDGIESSEQFAIKICKAIDQAEVVLFMHSAAHLNIDFEKDWTVRELNYAEQKEKRVVLVKLDDSKLEKIFLMNYGTRNNIDSREPVQMQKLISDLRSWLKLPAPAPEPKPAPKPAPVQKPEPKPAPTPQPAPALSIKIENDFTEKLKRQLGESDEERLKRYRRLGMTIQADELERKIKKAKRGWWGDVYDFFFDFSQVPLSHHLVALASLLVLLVYLIFSGFYTSHPSDPADWFWGLVFAYTGIRILVCWEVIDELERFLQKWPTASFWDKFFYAFAFPFAALFYPLIVMFPAFILGPILDKWLHWVDLHPLFLLCTYLPIAVYLAYSILLAFIQWKTDKKNR